MPQRRPGGTNTAGEKQKVVTPGFVRKTLSARHRSERKEGKKEDAQPKASEPVKALMLICFE